MTLALFRIFLWHYRNAIRNSTWIRCYNKDGETPCIYVWLCSFSLWICRRARSLYLSLSDAAVIACEFHRLTDTRSSSIYGSICVYDLSVSIRYACGTFIIFSMRCTLAANADSVAIWYISADVSLHRLHSAHFIFCLHLIHSTACIFGFSSVWLCVPTHERCIRWWSIQKPPIRLSNL